MGIIAILATLLLPSLAQAKRKARMIEELASARQLMLAVHLYASDNDEAVFPGYLPDPDLRDERGVPLPFPVNARYPWRLAPYIAHSIETLYTADNRARLRSLQRLDRAAYVYAVSVYPSLGINAYFLGGHDTEFPAPAANARFGSGTVVTRTGEIQHPSQLRAFFSAQSSPSGPEAYGYYHVTPPFLTRRRWTPDWSPTQPPSDWGFVAPRYARRAVTAAMDGHASVLGLTDLQDMTHWCNTADRPDFTLIPSN